MDVNEIINELAFNTPDGTRTSSLILAEGTGIQHKNVLELIKKHTPYLEEFGNIAFETRNPKGAGRPTEYALLNEQQATLLMTYMRNSKVVCEFKKNLVKAFYELVNGSANSLIHYNYSMDMARARKLEIESRLIHSARNIAAKTFTRNKKIQDQAFSQLCRKVVGYCPFEFLGVSMDHNAEEPETKIFDDFLSECCVIKAGKNIDKKELFEAFDSYQKIHSKPSQRYSYNYFCSLMTQKNFVQGRIGGGARFWRDLEVKKILPQIPTKKKIHNY